MHLWVKYSIEMQLQEYLAEKSQKFLSGMLHMKCLSKCSYSKKSVLLQKIPGGAPVTFMLIFHPNFYTNVWLFVNLPIYRKLIHDNITHVLYMRYETVCTYT